MDNLVGNQKSENLDGQERSMSAHPSGATQRMVPIRLEKLPQQIKKLVGRFTGRLGSKRSDRTTRTGDGGMKTALVALDQGDADVLGLKRGLMDTLGTGRDGPLACQALGRRGELYTAGPLPDKLFYCRVRLPNLLSALDDSAYWALVATASLTLSTCIEVRFWDPVMTPQLVSLSDHFSHRGIEAKFIFPLLPPGKYLQASYSLYLWGGGVETLKTWAASYQAHSCDLSMLAGLRVAERVEVIPISGDQELEACRRTLLAQLLPADQVKTIAPVAFLAPGSFEFLRLANEAVLGFQRRHRKRARAILHKSIPTARLCGLFATQGEDPFLSDDLDSKHVTDLSDWLHQGVEPEALVDFMLSSGYRISELEAARSA